MRPCSTDIKLDGELIGELADSIGNITGHVWRHDGKLWRECSETYEMTPATDDEALQALRAN